MANQWRDSTEPDLAAVSRHLTVLRDVEWLLALDELWTSYIAGKQQQPGDAPPNFAALRRLADDIDASVSRMPELAAQVATSLKALDDDAVNQGLGSLREDVPEAAPVVDWLFSEPGPDGPRTTLIRACGWVMQEAHAERGIIREKAALLERGQLPDPDIRPLFRCMGSLIGIGAGVALAAAGVVATLGVGATVALGSAAYIYGVAKVWEKDGCKETVRSATAAAGRLRPRAEG